MKDLITAKIDAAIKKLRSAKMWMRDQELDEESLLGMAEDDLNTAIDEIQSAINDLIILEQGGK